MVGIKVESRQWYAGTAGLHCAGGQSISAVNIAVNIRSDLAAAGHICFLC